MKLTIKGARAIRKTIDKHKLTPGKQRTLIRRIAAKIIVLARKFARNQQSPDGQSWAPRKHGNKKMLRKIPTAMLQISLDGGRAAKIVFRSNKMRGAKNSNLKTHPGIIARWQQDGVDATVNAGSLKRSGSLNRIYDLPATRRQQRALVKSGFKRKDTEKFKFGQAGKIIRRLRNQPVKQSWKIAVPARPFLGLTPQQEREIIAEALNSLQYGAGRTSANQIRSK